MKRKIFVIASILLAAVVIFILTNLNPRIVPQKKTYPEGTQTITAIWKGITLFGHSTGYPFTLEKLENGEWNEVTEKEGVMFHLPAFTLFHGKNFDYNISIYTDNITAGQYRIVTSMRNDKTGENISMYCEFEVK